MKEKTKQKIIDFSFAIMFIVILISLIVTVLNYFQKERDTMTQVYCDDLYGKDNWTMVDITGTLKADNIAGRFYIGQVWECGLQ